MSDAVELARLLNSGKVVVLKIGEVTVREPTLEQTLLILSNLTTLAHKFDTLNLGDNMEVLNLLMRDKDIRVEAESVAAACSGIDVSVLQKLGVSDWLRLIVAIKEVINWEELKELFFQVVPKSTLRSLTKDKSVTEVQQQQSAS